MASAVMICFLWKSLQEKREYDCFPVNHIACKQALRLQRATRGERERAREQRSREERRKRRSLSPSRTLVYPITWGSRATSRDFPKWRACSQAINHSAQRTNNIDSCFREPVFASNTLKNYNVINSFGWINVFRVKICKLLTFWSYRVLT